MLVVLEIVGILSFNGEQDNSPSGGRRIWWQRIKNIRKCRFFCTQARGQCHPTTTFSYLASTNLSYEHMSWRFIGRGQ